jgi:hypothetical protein
MKLLNFAVDSPIEVISDRLIWDLHNCGNFEGLDLLVKRKFGIDEMDGGLLLERPCK